MVGTRLRMVILVMTAAAVGSVGGCSEPAAPEASPAPARAEILEEIIEQAERGGALPEQLEVLEAAKDGKPVPYESLDMLYDDMLVCFDEAGWGYQEIDPEEQGGPGSGLFIPSYLYQPPTGMASSVADAMFDECNTRHVSFVMMYYSTEPVAIDAQIAQWDTPKLRECLIGRGYDVQPETTAAELNAMALDNTPQSGSAPGWTPCTS